MKGILIFKLVEARNLEAKDIDGLSDPYFILTLGSQRVITRTYENTINPIYEETFTFLLSPENNSNNNNNTLIIQGYDKDVMLKDDPLGTYELKIIEERVKEYDPVDEWVSLSGVSKGEVRISYAFISLDVSDGKTRDLYGFVVSDPVQASSPPFAQQHPAEISIHDLKREELSKFGIPLIYKPGLWLLHSGAKERKSQNKELYKQILSDLGKLNQETAEQIEKDLGRTFPGHPFFLHETGKGIPVLRRVLQAYSIKNPKIGYCQGMNFVAGLIILFLEEEDAFWLLDSIVDTILPNYYDCYLGGLQVDGRLIDYYFMQYFPDLKLHLERLQASPSINCMKWFLCIFVGIFCTEVTLRIWDTLFCSGRDVLLQVYLVLVRYKYAQILKATVSTDYYELLNRTPGTITTPRALFMDIFKHFSHLYQIKKLRVQSEKAIADSINKREELKLRTLTHFTIKELESLKQAFGQYSTNKLLTKDNFQKLLQTKLGSDILFAENIFKVFDKSGDGSVDFREFCMGLSAFTKGSLEERLTFCFSLFDVNGDGFVQPEELLQILETQYKILFRNEEPNFVKKFVDFAMVFDVNRDGKFSLEEFHEVIGRQPLVVQFLNLAKLNEDGNPVYEFKEEKKEEKVEKK